MQKYTINVSVVVALADDNRARVTAKSLLAGVRAAVPMHTSAYANVYGEDNGLVDLDGPEVTRGCD